MFKRVFDCVAAAAGLLMLAPLFLAIGILVKLGSPGPVFYRAPRVGRYGRLFHQLKFRSMWVGRPGPALTAGADPRITPLGRWLRWSKFDELPQLWNVFRGQMSLVGPRPEAPAYVTAYTAAQRQVLELRPGITGLASVVYAHEEEHLSRPDFEGFYREVLLPRKLALELAYYRSANFVLDCRLLVYTLFAIVLPPARRKHWTDSLVTSLSINPAFPT